MDDASVVVAGAGLAGLGSARRLAERGLDVQVFEREAAVGGRVRTRRKDGFVLDRGFQVLFTAYPAARRELDYDALDLRRFAPGAWIARPDRRSLLSDPLRDPRGITESLFNTEVTVGDKLRTLRLRRRLSGKPAAPILDDGDTTIRRYLRDRGFSERFVGNFAAPFYGGITLDRSLSASSSVFEYTFKMLAAGSIAVPADGMGAIPEQLADAAREAGATIRTGTAVEAVESDGDGVSVVHADGTTEADAAVIATGPHTARELTDVDAIPVETAGCVTQYYALSQGLDAGPRLLLNADDATPNHVVPHSAVAPEHAPDDAALISATFLGEPDATDRELADHTREALAAWYPERGFDLDTVHTARVSGAQFVQPPGFRDRLPDVRAPDGRIYLAGDVTEWSSIQGALESGRTAAEAVATDLR